MVVLGLDPGPDYSAYVLLNGDGTIHTAAKRPNHDVLCAIKADADRYTLTVVCERIRSYGMPAGASLFETCEWSGRFMEAWISRDIRHNWYWIERKEVKMALCGSTRAKDANIRQALIDRYGGKDAAIGCKAKPGPLYGIKADVWAALAVAVAWKDLQKVKVA